MSEVVPHTLTGEQIEAIRKELPEIERDRFDELLSEIDDLRAALESTETVLHDDLVEAQSALSDVRFWFLDVMVHGRVPRNPRDVLRQVEGALSNG